MIFLNMLILMWYNTIRNFNKGKRKDKTMEIENLEIKLKIKNEKTKEKLEVESEDSETKNEDVPMKKILGEIEKLNKKIDGINELFLKKIQIIDFERKTADKLHKELQKYKNDMYFQLIEPLVKDLINIRESMREELKIFRKKTTEKMKKYVFGIDLGTTYSCIARVDDTGKPEIIKNNEGENLTPSAVQFDGDIVIVGDTAKEEAVLNPKATVMLVKTLMGKTDFAISYNGKNICPEEISSYILKKLVKDASEQLGVEVKDVVITCPAYFGTAEREATRNAGGIAGLNVLGIISEPTAAALYYGCTKEQEEKIILIYDLGGATFDVTIMRITSNKIEIICSVGNHDLGGKDWDEILIRYLAEQFKEKIREKVEFDDYATQDLRLKAERMKKRLTFRTETAAILEVAEKKQKISITREKFDEITSTLLNETIKKTKDAIEIAEKKGYGNIDEILLVGGSTRMPQVKEALSKEFGDSKIKILEPDEAVAKGAAIYAVNTYIHNQEKINNKFIIC